jgi:GNAT superfamily N-acetyltransferase
MTQPLILTEGLATRYGKRPASPGLRVRSLSGGDHRALEAIFAGLSMQSRWQRRGVGTRLLRELTQIAQRLGYRTLDAELLTTNRLMGTRVARAGRSHRHGERKNADDQMGWSAHPALRSRAHWAP